MSAFDGEAQRRLTIRMADPFGYLLFEMNVLVPASMVSHLMTDWTNTLTLKSSDTPDIPYRMDVVLK